MKIMALDLGKSKSVAYRLDTETGEVGFQTVLTRPAPWRDCGRARRFSRLTPQVVRRWGLGHSPHLRRQAWPASTVAGRTGTVGRCP